MELHEHTANHWEPLVSLTYIAPGQYEYRAGTNFSEYDAAEPRIVSREAAISLWPDDNGAEVVTAITEARTPISLQQFIAQLEALPADTALTLDIGGSLDDVPDPYRGWYKDMSLMPSQSGLLAGEMARTLAFHLGDTRTGYKGGEFMVHGQCGLWIADYGEASYRGVKGVTADGVVETALMSRTRDPVAVQCPHCRGTGHIQT